MSIDEWFEQASNHTDDYFWAMAEEVPKVRRSAAPLARL